MRTAFVLAVVYLFVWAAPAGAASCMLNSAAGKIQFCYHKSADGRCALYGPDCESARTALARKNNPPANVRTGNPASPEEMSGGSGRSEDSGKR